jgi:hypothetical protein
MVPQPTTLPRAPPDIIRIIKSRRLRWVWHVEPTEDEKYEATSVEKPGGKRLWMT